jgi:hypothetical protein
MHFALPARTRTRVSLADTDITELEKCLDDVENLHLIDGNIDDLEVDDNEDAA